ncbi:MAG: DUF349 domain-containing protein [Balneolaceae bacterium]|nr:DUF349 domain-containing protein [Balneolaceae bacterium]
MEEAKTTSQYIYEDEFSFVNQEKELFLKESDHFEKRKLAEVSEEKIDEKVQELKKAFTSLQKKVEGLENPDPGEVEEIQEELKKAEAIGDFDVLLDQLSNLPTADNETETEAAKEEDSEMDESEVDSEAKGITFYKDIVAKAGKLSKQNDWPYVSSELDSLSREWAEGPDLDSDEVAKLFKKFNDIVDAFEKRKEEHYENLKKQREGNLEKKKSLLSQLKEIIDEEEWGATGKVGKIKSQWNAVGSLPSGKGEDLDSTFESYLNTFNDHKVDRLVQKRQKEEQNLMLKLSILDKMEKAASSIDNSTQNWKELDDEFEDLTKQWKKVGRVPKEKSNEVWSRYKAAQDEYYDRKYRYDRKHQSKVDKFTSKKEQIIEEAEALLEEQDLATAARKINRLHHRWKKVGNLPQRAEDRLWDRFKSATDAFNERKSNNIDKIKEQEEEHYKQKLELIEQAESIKDTDDFDKGHQQMQQLMKEWKAIGPVQRKKSNKIWKKFKGAMDVFYDRRRDHFKDQKEERKENLEEKQEILEKLKELGQHEDPIEAVEIAKELQEKFKSAGYVPIKHKNEMWKKYREACDVIYDRFRAAKSGDKFDRELAKADLDPEQRSKIQDMRKEYKKVKKEVNQLENEVLQYQEKKTYFKPSKGENPLLKEVQQKIDKVENKLHKKQDKLESLTKEMEEIKQD